MACHDTLRYQSLHFNVNRSFSWRHIFPKTDSPTPPICYTFNIRNAYIANRSNFNSLVFFSSYPGERKERSSATIERKEGRKEGRVGGLALLKFPKKRRLIPLCTGCLSIWPVPSAIFVPLFLSAALLPYFFSWMIRELAEWLETGTTETVSCTMRARIYTHTHTVASIEQKLLSWLAMQSWIFSLRSLFPSLSFLGSIERGISIFLANIINLFATTRVLFRWKQRNFPWHFRDW